MTKDGEIRNMLRAQGLCGQMFDGKACVELKDHDAGIHERGWRVTRRVDEDPYAKDSRETITRYVVSDGVRLFKADDEKSANWLVEILNTIETK